MKKINELPKKKLNLNKRTIAKLNSPLQNQKQGKENLSVVGYTCDTNSGDEICNGTIATSN